MPITVDSARAALSKVIDPELGRSLTDVGIAAEIAIEDGDTVSLLLALPAPGPAYRHRVEHLAREALREAGAKAVAVRFETIIPTRNILPDDPCPGVKNIVLVMSGKGGVGKSTVATNLTLAASRLGARVGLLDADMYGPSIPTMLGVSGRPTSSDGQKFLPLERFGVKLMSIGFLLEDPRAAVVWRGPMLQNALLQFLRDVEWGELKYFFSSGVSSDSGDNQSSKSVQAKIQKLIDAEDPYKPLSDQKIADILKKEEGTIVARRTVTKYREALNIPPTTKRKKFK